MEVKTQKPVPYLFFIVCGLFSVAASCAHPVTPALFLRLQLPDYMFGVALASMQCVTFFFSPFWGKMNGYIGSRTSMLICCLGYSGGQALFAMADSAGMVIIARMVAGIFTGGVFTSILNYVVNSYEGTQKGTYLAVSATLQTVCGAMGYFVGGMLGEISLHTALWTQTFSLAACGVLLYFVCHDDARYALSELRLGAVARDANPFAAFVQARSFLTPTFAALFAVCMLSNLAYTSFDQSFNYYAVAQFHFSTGFNGTIKAVIAAVSLLANMTVGLWIIRKTNVTHSSVIVLGLCSVAMLGVVLLNSVVPFIVAILLLFAVNSVSVPLTQSIVAQRGEGRTDSNLIMGFYNGIRSLGGIVGALSSGFLYTVWPKGPFAFALAAFVLSTGFAAFYNKNINRGKL